MTQDPPAADLSSAPGASTGLVFVADASAEAERLTVALRARGYPVVDVPLGLLLSRVAVQRPALILLDADARGALDIARDVKASREGDEVRVVLIGERDRTLASMGRSVDEIGVTFLRPVEVYSLLRKVEALIGPPAEGAPGGQVAHALRPTVLVASARKPYRYEGRGASPPQPDTDSPPPSPAQGSKPATQPPQSDRPASKPPIQSVAPGLLAQAPVDALGLAELSDELKALLEHADAQVSGAELPEAPRRLTPEQEVDVVLPMDVLDALDEPLDLDDDGEGSEESEGTRDGTDRGRNTRSHGTTRSGTTGNHAVLVDALDRPEPAQADALPGEPLVTPVPTITHGPAPTSPPTGVREEVPSTPKPPAPPPRGAPATPQPEPLAMHEQRASSPPTSPPPPTTDDRASRPTTAPPFPRPGATPAEPASDPGFTSGRGPWNGRTGPTAPISLPSSLGDRDSVRVLAAAVRSRLTGALAFEDSAGIRRVVFREGDLTIAMSSAEDETLVAFLVRHGDLAPEVDATLGRRIAPFGRHAGAALIAHGHLAQDDLWQVLRAHAEWVVGRIVAMTRGAVSWESEVPSRLREEPAVFGGATGAEVLVEVVRRVVDSPTALTRLGGDQVRLAPGSAASLLDECALDADERRRVEQASGSRPGELLDPTAPPGFAAVLYSLVELGVLCTMATVGPPAQVRPTDRAHDSIDDEAVRARILARRALVEESDYFTLLGVSHDATSYDIRRAYLELKRQLAPEKTLTARTADLSPALSLIHEVLDEAYAILHDDARRERYRRALVAPPGR